MKKQLLSLAFILTAFGAIAQNWSEIFISQYVEGKGNNKALGIYNPTMNPIYLNNQYRLIRYNNGSSAAAGEATNQAMINLGNDTIASGQEWVIVIDMRDPAGTGQNAPADTALQAKANIFLCPDYNTSFSMYFNGNDALSIQKTLDGGTTWNYVDIFAQIGDAAMTGNNGTGGWGDVFPYDNAMWPTAWTLDHTMIRKAAVKQGVTANPSSFNPFVEWDSLFVDTYDSLRIHNCNCPKAAGVNEIDNSVSIQLFPNPVSNNHFTITSSELMQSVELYNVVGQKVLRKEENRSAKQLAVETGNIPEGIYAVRISFQNGKTKTVKLIVQ